MTKVCCICQRIEEEKGWRSEPLIAAGTLLSHGFCPECFAQTMAEVREFFSTESKEGCGEKSKPLRRAKRRSCGLS